MATHSSILAWRIPMDRGAWQAIVHRVAKSQTRLIFFWAPKSLQMVTAAMKLKDACSLEEKL